MAAGVQAKKARLLTRSYILIRYSNEYNLPKSTYFSKSTFFTKFTYYLKSTYFPKSTYFRKSP